MTARELDTLRTLVARGRRAQHAVDLVCALPARRQRRKALPPPQPAKRQRTRA